MDKKKLHTVGPYKPKEDKVHKLGAIYSSNVLFGLLDEYGMEFEPGKTVKIKNSPRGIKMYVNTAGEPSGKVIKINRTINN